VWTTLEDFEVADATRGHAGGGREILSAQIPRLADPLEERD
jgi:hypothetical protein